MKQESRKFDKELILYIVLAGFFLTNALIAEVIGVKIFSVEKLLGLPPLNLPFIGTEKFNFDLSVGILIWPVVFIVSDIINEYFGKPGVRRLSILASILIAYAFVIILFGTKLPPSEYWLRINGFDGNGNSFNINHAYNTVFRQGMSIIVASITAFLVGQIIDLYVFHYIRQHTGHKMLWLRANGSNIISQLVDSFLILIIAFYWLGDWSFSKVLALGLGQYIYKISIAGLLTPLIYWLHFVIDRYLGREHSDEMINKAEEKVNEIVTEKVIDKAEEKVEF